MSSKGIKTVLAVTLLLLAVLAAYHKLYGVPKVYFQYLNHYIYCIGVLWILVLTMSLIPAASKGTQVLAPVLLGITGYALLEIIYGKYGIILPVMNNHVVDIISGDLNYYFIHRSYQYIPLLLMFLVLFRDRDSQAQSLLKAGDWNVETDVLGGSQKMTWKTVIRRICLITIILACLALVLRITLSPLLKCNLLMKPLADQLVLFPFDILGALNNCFIEEFLFRGMLLSIFSKAIGHKWGNFLQAFLFGLVHYPSFSLSHYLAKVVVFTFIGWLFGRASLETGGIKSSWVMHSVIVISMFLAQTI